MGYGASGFSRSFETLQRTGRIAGQQIAGRVRPVAHNPTGQQGNAMKSAQLARLRIVSLAFMLPGLAGLIVSAMISMHYLDTMPRWPSPQEMRMTPRNIHGIVVYQTKAEDRQLNLMEYASVAVFLSGLTLGLVYLDRWSARQARAGEEEDPLKEKAR